MPYTVTTRKRGGFEYTSLAETEAAALVLARMMRKAGDEYCAEATVTVCDKAGQLLAGWRGGGYGWQPMPLQPRRANDSGLQPLVPATRREPPGVPSGRFATLPTDPMMEASMASVTEHSFA